MSRNHHRHYIGGGGDLPINPTPRPQAIFEIRAKSRKMPAMETNLEELPEKAAGNTKQIIMDRVIDVSVMDIGEHDPGKMIALTEAGLIWILDGDSGYQGQQTQYWYRVSSPPGCFGADGQ